ncbi:hypothetical protein [Bordetella bronchiseptica]|uniref:hypothetical protein n=1 Tax=Bordetella bronchiseptica TaxID=518 RepID=UPI002DD6260A|nr:hypothetical protein [Bordetella bronchiseptica]
MLALALGFQGTAAWANCTTSGSSTTCTAAGGAHGAKVGGGSSGNNQQVTVQAGARIEVGDSAAISVGNNSQVQIQGGAVVQSTVVTPPSSGTLHANTVEGVASNTIDIAPNAQVLAKGTNLAAEALGLSGAGNTVNNRGTIQADQAAAIWVDVNAANSANTINNYGTIETRRNGGDATAIGSTRDASSTGAGVTLRNHSGGRIVGHLDFAGGDDSVVLEGGSSISGHLN